MTYHKGQTLKKGGTTLKIVGVAGDMYVVDKQETIGGIAVVYPVRLLLTEEELADYELVEEKPNEHTPQCPIGSHAHAIEQKKEQICGGSGGGAGCSHEHSYIGGSGSIENGEVKTSGYSEYKWIPEVKEEYFYIATAGDVQIGKWCEDTFNHFRLSVGNVHKTRKEAEEYKQRWQKWGGK